MNLKELRKLKGLSQEETSKLVGIPLRTYKRIEKEDKKDTFKYINAFNILKDYKEVASKLPQDSSNYKIAVAGIGYVGLSLGILLSQDNEVTMVDLIKEKVEQINNKVSPINDELIKEYLANKQLNLKAEVFNENSYKEKDIVIIATPTNFDNETKNFDTSSVESIIEEVNRVNPTALVVIKSTVSIGFTRNIQSKYPNLNIVFSPEFLREGFALYDNLYPSRIIIGSSKENKMANVFAHLLEKHAKNLNKALFMSSNEAEAVKLFSNAYLAMRVAYFNELDSYALSHDLDTNNIIKGMSLDPRIGDYYNNPSFGYGGYCLPKDSAQLSSSFVGIGNSNLIRALLISNQTRKEFIAENVIKKAKEISNKTKEELVIGIYKLAMKANSDNYRSSSSLDIVNILIDKGYKVVVYEPSFEDNIPFDEFVSISDIIVTNRMYKELNSLKYKVFTRDIYKRD